MTLVTSCPSSLITGSLPAFRGGAYGPQHRHRRTARRPQPVGLPGCRPLEMTPKGIGTTVPPQPSVDKDPARHPSISSPIRSGSERIIAPLSLLRRVVALRGGATSDG